MVIFADHLGSGDYAMSWMFIVAVAVLAALAFAMAWHSSARPVRLAWAITAVAFVAITWQVAANWEDVTDVMDGIAGPEGGEFRIEFVPDLIERSIANPFVIGILLASPVAWLVAWAGRARHGEAAAPRH